MIQGKYIFALVGLIMFGFSGTEVQAQSKKKKKKGKTEEASPKKDGDKSFDDLLKSTASDSGLLTIHRDTVTGKSFLEIQEAQLGKEFIYFSVVADGVLEAGFFRGSYRGSKIIRFVRHFDRIEIQSPNTDYYFDEDNALSKAASANINTPILSSLKIEAEKEGRILLDGDAVFLSEDFQMVKPPSRPGPNSGGGLLGNLSKDKTKIKSIRNYPENTDVVVSYFYDNKNPTRGGSPAITDPRSIEVAYQHSIIEMPDDDFVPRKDDARVGYFMTQVTDMTSFDATPYRDMIHRWRLIKKDPSAALSEPVEPITWWIENTTPEEFRPIIKAGVERWNQSFEKAGFKNAVVVNIQPDDAEWDAGDIRYNVLRWTSSPMPPFGGYGPSFVNPRTGEILGADIMLEFVSVTGRLFRTEVFKLAGMDMDETSDEHSLTDHDHYNCNISNHIQHSLQFGLHGMKAMNVDKASQEEFVKQTLYRLSLHEVGHTLGLTHNMKASSIHSPADLKKKSVIDQWGLCNSVMEYPAVHFPTDEMDHETWFDSNPGAYDDWVIEYGYSEGLADAAAEEARLRKILERSSDPMLRYGNDADDMRGSGRGIDPDVNIYDLSNDPVLYAAERCDLVKEIMPKIKAAYTIENQSYHEFRNAYLILTSEYANQINVMTRQIAGIHVDRAYVGQETSHKPLEPVSEAKQREAMSALSKYAFAPDAFNESTEIYNYLQMQRRGFGHSGNNEDPRLHERVQFMQIRCLSHLTHPNVLQRITDSQLYGNTYDLAEYFTDLTDAIFKADMNSKVNTYRQNLQASYVDIVVKIIDKKSKYDQVSQGMAVYELKRIEKSIKSASSSDKLTKAHREHLSWKIAQALEG